MSIKKKLSVTVVAVSFVATGIVAFEPGTKQLTPKWSATKERRFLEKTGGLLRVPGIGKVVVANCQKVLPDSVFAKEVSQFAGMTCAKFEGATIDGFDFTTPRKIKTKLGAQAAIFIIYEPSLPMCLLSPEENWSFVNVAPIAASTSDQAKIESRVRRELVRAGSLALGAWVSRMEKSTLLAVADPSGLDALPVDYLTANEFQSVMNYLPSIGIKPYSLTTYKNACKEGWAPAPTNDVQKAIWEKVKSDKERGPTNPITIQPPKAK